MCQFDQLKLRYENTSARLREVVSSLRRHLDDVEEEHVQREMSVKADSESDDEYGVCERCGVPDGAYDGLEVSCNCSS
jgi:hypothetical protein